jgi:hypothetical protein
MKAINRPLWELELRLAIGDYFRTEEPYKVLTSAGKYTLKIYKDEDLRNPREDSNNLSHMLFSHTGYNLGDTELWKELYISTNDFDSWPEMGEYLKRELKPTHLYPIRMYDHSGLTISMNIHQYPYNDRWDSGQIGFVYCTKEDIRNWWKIKYVTSWLRRKALDHLRGEIKTYDLYLRQEVYGFDLSCDNEDLCDIGGYYGNEVKDNGMLEEVIDIITRHTNKVVNNDKEHLHI